MFYIDFEGDDSVGNIVFVLMIIMTGVLFWTDSVYLNKWLFLYAGYNFGWVMRGI